MRIITRIYHELWSLVPKQQPSSDNFQLHSESGDGDLERIANLIDQGADVNAQDAKNKTPLHWAAGKNQLEAAHYLIWMGCHIDVKDESGYTPLLKAADKGHQMIVKLLLASGADISVCDKYNWNLLHCASKWNWLNMARDLLKGGKLNMDMVSVAGHTPLIVGASRRNWDLVKLLLDSGADASVCDARNLNVLHHAASDNELEIVRCVLRQGKLDMDMQTFRGKTALMLAVVHRCTEIAELLLSSGADTSGCDNYGWSLLHCSFYGYELDIAREVLERREVDVNGRSGAGETALFMAVLHRYSEFVDLLLTWGADVNVKDNEDKTAFYFAGKRSEDFMLLRLLIEHGAYFESSIYQKIFNEESLRNQILGSTDLSTTAIINKFNCDWLPVIYDKLEPFTKLPQLNALKIRSSQNVGREIGEFVAEEIKRKTFCNVMEVRPLVLKWLCAKSVVGCLSPS